jgi:hypothetical protein
MIVVGTRLYGKVDEVPGLFHLATEFFCLNFVPLIPLRSFLVFSGTERGIPMRLSGKSMFFAYLRVALLVGVVAGAVPAPFMLADRPNGRAAHLPACLGLLAGAQDVECCSA